MSAICFITAKNSNSCVKKSASHLHSILCFLKIDLQKHLELNENFAKLGLDHDLKHGPAKTAFK